MDLLCKYASVDAGGADLELAKRSAQLGDAEYSELDDAVLRHLASYRESTQSLEYETLDCGSRMEYTDSHGRRVTHANACFVLSFVRGLELVFGEPAITRAVKDELARRLLPPDNQMTEVSDIAVTNIGELLFDLNVRLHVYYNFGAPQVHSVNVTYGDIKHRVIGKDITNGKRNVRLLLQQNHFTLLLPNLIKQGPSH